MSVLNESTLLFIPFVIASSLNISRSRLSHVTLGYTEDDTKSRFQEVFSSYVDSCGCWKADLRLVETRSLYADISRLWVCSTPL